MQGVDQGLLGFKEGMVEGGAYVVRRAAGTVGYEEFRGGGVFRGGGSSHGGNGGFEVITPGFASGGHGGGEVVGHKGFCSEGA